MKLHHVAIRTNDLYAELSPLLQDGYKVVKTYRVQLEEGFSKSAHLVADDRRCDLFVSEGTYASIVDLWVGEHGPGIHHLAFEVDNVEQTMLALFLAGLEFTTKEVIRCPCEDSLEQVFTKPIRGLVLELIKPAGHDGGFCHHNVRALMESTKDEA